MAKLPKHVNEMEGGLHGQPAPSRMDNDSPRTSQEDGTSRADEADGLEKRIAAAAARAKALRESRNKASRSQQPIRAINEDDDGYDPYTDLHDRGAEIPLFERDPWS